MGSSATNPPTGADGVQLRALRKNLGLTQSQLAERLRVSAITVHRWEAGKSRPHPMARQQLEEIAEAVAMAAQRARPADGGLRDRSRRLLSQATSVGADRTHSERFAPIPAPSLDFAGDAEAVSAVVEAWRLAYGHQFNPAFGSETSRIDPLPHQRIAVYERMLRQEPLRFLLADDAGAGKTIMTGLYVREMLSRGRIRRVLVVPPAGLVGNWRRELRTLFRLDFRIVTGADVRGGGGAGARRRASAANGTASDGDAGNLFLDPSADLAIVSLDTLVGDKVFAALREAGGAAAYDLVVFDEAHKLSATADDHRVRKTRRYELAEALAGCGNPAERFAGLEWSARHLLLLTATPHMGKSSPYHYLWRLLDDQVFPTEAALRRFPPAARSRHFIRRTKEEMVDLQGRPIYPLRSCDTFSYDLTPGPDGEQALYDETTAYLRHTYGRAFRNRPAVSLAMSVFQRRLASSTHALLRSFERRIAKLKGAAADLAAGRITTDELERRQTAIGKAHAADFFDSSTADEDGREQDDREDADGSRRARERNEDYEDAVLGAVIVVAVEEIEQEVRTLVQLRDRARRLMDTGRESKFEKLRELLEDARYADEKWLVFSEHRDTVDYLVRRLEGLGHAGSIAHIHGGMAWQEREAQVERFRDPAGARYMVATDAAGEGINLQFCRLMANYDIPWNPARLEQRMGRVHRYGQKRDVRIVNLVAGKTHEGRVLEVLLKKLNAIRRELKSDKVFDVIGRLFENAPLGRYMLESLQAGTNGGASGEDGAAGDAAQRVERALTSDRVRTIGAEERDAYGDADNVKDRLPGLRGDMDRERYLQLLPGYVRHFVGRAAGLLGLQIRGDLDAFFGLAASRSGALDPLLPALDSYPEEARARLCVSRPENIVRKGEGPERSSASLTPSANDGPSIWLRPGEPVFDALAGAVQEAFAQDALRGRRVRGPSRRGPLHVPCGRGHRRGGTGSRGRRRKRIRCRPVAPRSGGAGARPARPTRSRSSASRVAPRRQRRPGAVRGRELPCLERRPASASRGRPAGQPRAVDARRGGCPRGGLSPRRVRGGTARAKTGGTPRAAPAGGHGVRPARPASRPSPQGAGRPRRQRSRRRRRSPRAGQARTADRVLPTPARARSTRRRPGPHRSRRRPLPGARPGRARRRLRRRRSGPPRRPSRGDRRERRRRLGARARRRRSRRVQARPGPRRRPPRLARLRHDV